MSTPRKPVAEPLAEGGVLVKHTHDVHVAADLAGALVAWQYYEEFGEVYLRKVRWQRARPIWCRILGILPGSLGAAEGWAWEYCTTNGPGRGAFRAVEFLP